MRRTLITAAVLLLLIVAGVAWLAHLHGGSRAAEAVPDTVRSVVYDTVTVANPDPVQTTQLPGMVMRLPLWRAHLINEASKNHFPDIVMDSVQKSRIVNSCEAHVFTDSADVIIPMERKVYEDSTYRAVITGAWVSLDTMQVYPRRETVTIRHPPDRRKRWGVSAGIGAAVTTDGRIRPALFLGATYTFATF